MKLNIGCLLINTLVVLNMQYYIFYILGFLCIAYKMIKIRIYKEPFKGLFTQGMVCHETYKDKNNQWLSPDELSETCENKFY